jgi:hypothetical protein
MSGYKGATMRGTNAPTKPRFEGEIVIFKSPHANIQLFDIARLNQKYGVLEWWALNDPTEEQINQARTL